jgi:glycosyltransferase involved in cell wall biosynthesis
MNNILYTFSTSELNIVSNRELNDQGQFLGADEKIKATVITLSFNNNIYLKEALSSLEKQTSDEFEIIIGDDGSADGSHLEIRRFVSSSSRPVLAILRLSNKGLVANYNYCVKTARGKYIANFSSDDICDFRRIENQLKALVTSRKSMCISDLEIINKDANTVAYRVVEESSYLLDNVLKSGRNPITSPTVFFDREIFNKFGYIAEDLINEDEALAMMALADNGIVILHEFLVKYRIHDSSIMGSNSRRNFFDFYYKNLPFMIRNKLNWLEILTVSGKVDKYKTIQNDVTKMRLQFEFLQTYMELNFFSRCKTLISTYIGRNLITHAFQHQRSRVGRSWLQLRRILLMSPVLKRY